MASINFAFNRDYETVQPDHSAFALDPVTPKVEKNSVAMGGFGEATPLSKVATAGVSMKTPSFKKDTHVSDGLGLTTGADKDLIASGGAGFTPG